MTIRNYPECIDVGPLSAEYFEAYLPDWACRLLSILWKERESLESMLEAQNILSKFYQFRVLDLGGTRERCKLNGCDNLYVRPVNTIIELLMQSDVLDCEDTSLTRFLNFLSVRDSLPFFTQREADAFDSLNSVLTEEIAQLKSETLKG